MDTNNILRLVLLVATLTTPFSSTAYTLGDIQIQSNLGQPFRATIPIQTRGEEEIDPDCLSLSPPPAESDMVYLRRATLSLVRHGNKIQVLISGLFPLDEPYLNVAISLGCKDQGQMIRVYTALIDPPHYTFMPSTPSSTEEDVRPTTKIKTTDRGESQETLPARAVKGKTGQILGTSKSQKNLKKRQDQLKVLSGSGEKPAQPGLSEKERLQQHEKELMKELDDKTAKHLEMQAKLVKMESKLVEMQKMLEQQNKLIASMQLTAAAPAKKTVISWDNGYWIAGPFALIAGLGFFLARRSRKLNLV